MAENTTIEWATHTFNPWIGCTKISAACDNCYAANFGNRFGIEWGAGKPRKRTSESTWKQPIRWNRQAEIKQNAWDNFKKHYTKVSDEQLTERGFVKPQRPRVFCASLADVFDNEVPDEWCAELFGLIRDTPYLDWLLLTKRIGNAYDMMNRSGKFTAEYFGDAIGFLAPSNLWLGATICNQEEADRDIPKLLTTPAAKRFVSIEPMLSAIDLRMVTDYRAQIDWVICGGESGKNARPMHPNWVRSLRDQCADAGVPFLFKQWGEWREPLGGEEFDTSRGMAQKVPAFIVSKNGSVSCFENDENKTTGKAMLRVGKKLAGRLLDGVLHNETHNERW